jgi:cytochrome c oxidase subunit 4
MADHSHDNHPPFNHPAPKPLLYAVFGALIFFTILTVVVSNFELGAFGFPIAMFLATIKATLVCAFFMHMYWDKGFNILFFLSSVLFVSLLIGMTLLDTDQYMDTIDLFPREPDAITLPADTTP